MVSWLQSLLNGRSEAQPPVFKAQVDSLIEQAADSIALYGDHVGIRVVRKHLSAAFEFWSEQNLINEDQKTIRKAACEAETLEALKASLSQLVGSRMEIAA
jgi:hypothetical protein